MWGISRSFLKKTGKKFVETYGITYLCLAFEARTLSAAGSEHLPYKQGVGGSNPSASTKLRDTFQSGISERSISFALIQRITMDREITSKQRLRFAVFGSLRQAVQKATISDIFAALQENDSEIFVDSTFAKRITEVGVPMDGIEVFESEDFSADFAISIGGDGTLLKTAMRINEKNIPIMGVNMGRMGFLADVMPSEIHMAVADLYSGNYAMESHSVLSVKIDDEKSLGESFALNDVAILKRDTASMISISVKIDEEYVATFRADGLIVATPTGSTAYNLSNGGPIMASTAKTLCLTAVAPHSLNLRPVVIDENSVIKMRVESRSRNFLLAVDGRSTTLTQGRGIVVKKAPYTIKMVKLPNKQYFDTLRKKMMWAADMRE